MESSRFQTALYKNYRALYVSPISKLAPRLDLLDVLIQKRSEGLLHRRPVLYRVGSLLDLGSASSEAEQEKLRRGREDFWAGKGSEDDIFHWSRGDVPDFKETLLSASSLIGSILAGLADAKIHFSGSNKLKVTIEDMSTASVKYEALARMMHQKKWKLNIDDPLLQRADGRRNEVMLWVAHDLLYAKTMTIKSSSESKKECKLLPGIASAVASPGISVPGVEVIRSRANANGLEIRSGGGDGYPASRVKDKFLFAFRMVGFKFDANGNCIGFEHDPGSAEPIHRAPESKLSHGDQRKIIRDLYQETAPEYYSDDDDDDDDDDHEDPRNLVWTDLDLVRLAIVDIDGELDMPLDEVSLNLKP